MTILSLDRYTSIVGKTMGHAEEGHSGEGLDIPFLGVVDPCQNRHICARYAKKS
jgi:hypothetical protein